MTKERRRELLKKFHPDANGGSNRHLARLLTVLSIPIVKFGRCEMCGVTINENAKRCKTCHQVYLAARRKPRPQVAAAA